MQVVSLCEKDTEEVGKMLGCEARRGDVFCLVGDLSAGKTHFTKGFAEGLLIEDEIVSPTFSIVNTYSEGRIKFHHFDVYRLENQNELENIGYEDYFYGDGVCLIEWADMIKDYIPDTAIWITIKKDLSKGENYRDIEIGDSENDGE